MIRPHRRHLLAALTAGALAPGLAAHAQDADARRWLAYNQRLEAGLDGAVSFDREAEGELDALANRFRMGEGRETLSPHEGLTRAARAHAADMAIRGFFDHQSPDGFHPSERVGLLVRDFCGVSGENIAEIFGSADQGSAAFMQLWRESRGHRENLLRPDYDHVGSAVARVGDRTWAAQVFAQTTIRLAADAPLQVRDPRDLRACLAGADPAFDRFQIAATEGEAASPVVSLDEDVIPPRGVWRLRPHLRTAVEGRVQRYAVLWGPIFIA